MWLTWRARYMWHTRWAWVWSWEMWKCCWYWSGEHLREVPHPADAAQMDIEAICN